MDEYYIELDDRGCPLNSTYAGEDSYYENCEEVYDLRQQRFEIIKYTCPIIYLIGTIGNMTIMAAIIFARYSRLQRRLSTFDFYLVVLAFADISALWIHFLKEYLPAIANYNIDNANAAVCKIFWIVTLISDHFAVWLVCAVSVDRMINVGFSFRMRKSCSFRSAPIAVVIMFVLAGVINIPWSFILQYTSSEKTCYPQTRGLTSFQKFYSKHYDWIYFSFFSFLPFLVILGTNTVLMYKIHESSKKYMDTKRGASVRTRGVSFKTSIRMLIPMCVVFLLTTLPYTIVRFYAKDPSDDDLVDMDDVQFEKTVTYQSLTNALRTVNHASNFIIYGVVGGKFRKLVKHMLLCGRYFPYDLQKTPGLIAKRHSQNNMYALNGRILGLTYRTRAGTCSTPVRISTLQPLLARRSVSHSDLNAARFSPASGNQNHVNEVTSVSDTQDTPLHTCNTVDETMTVNFSDTNTSSITDDTAAEKVPLKEVRKQNKRSFSLRKKSQPEQEKKKRRQSDFLARRASVFGSLDTI